MILSEFHNKFPGSCLWRVTEQGIEVKGSGLIQPAADQLARAGKYTDLYAGLYAAAAKEYGVPVELLIACSMT
jgi:hypothetical protein